MNPALRRKWDTLYLLVLGVAPALPVGPEDVWYHFVMIGHLRYAFPNECFLRDDVGDLLRVNPHRFRDLPVYIPPGWRSLPPTDALRARRRSNPSTHMSLLTTHDGSPDGGDHASPLLDAVDSVMTRRIPVAESGMSHATDSHNARLSVFSDSGELAKDHLYSVTPPPPSGVPAVPTLSSPLETVSVRAKCVESPDSDFLFLGVDGAPDTPTPKRHGPRTNSVFGIGLENTLRKNRAQKLTPNVLGTHGALNCLLQYGGDMVRMHQLARASAGVHNAILVRVSKYIHCQQC